MSKKDEAVRLLRFGMSPGAISGKQQVTLSTILKYLNQAVGDGTIRRSDILFSVPKQIRDEVFRLSTEGDKWGTNSRYRRGKIVERLQAQNINATEDDIEVILQYRDKRFAFGDMYEDLRSIEIHLHSLLREALEQKYGEDWWHKGIPGQVRKQCWSRKDKQKSENNPYTFTDLPDLERIATEQWEAVSSKVPQKVAVDSRQFADIIKQLNRIRRRVMHPVRGESPSDEDFQFVHTLKANLGLRL
jgi:hypothetical protein